MFNMDVFFNEMFEKITNLDIEIMKLAILNGIKDSEDD